MTKTERPESQKVKPLIWDVDPLDTFTRYIKAIDTRTGTTYFAEPFRSEYSGYRLWKVYCLSADATADSLTVQAACDNTARRFKSLVQAKETCDRHAAGLGWPEVQVAVALTCQQYHLACRVIPLAEKSGTTFAPQNAVNAALRAAIEAQIPPQFKLPKQPVAPCRSAPREEETVHVLLSEPEFYALFRCLSHGNEDEREPEKKAVRDKLHRMLFRKIAAHEQRLFSAGTARSKRL